MIDIKKEKNFKGKVRRWAKKIGVKPEKIIFKEMKNRWALCVNKKTVFNSKLILMPPAFQRAVIIHELLHLNIPNHGKLFKALFLSYMPDGDKALKINSFNQKIF